MLLQGIMGSATLCKITTRATVDCPENNLSNTLFFEWVMAWSGCKALDDKEESRRSSLSEQLLRRESSDLARRESWQSECSWGDEGSTCLGLAIDGPWSSENPAFDSQSEISTEVRE